MIVVHKAVAHPHLCDIMGHLTTRHYMAMFDDASYHFLYQVFGWSGAHATENDQGWADVKHVIDYHSEISPGDLLEIRAELRKVGNKSITVEYYMFNLTRNELAATLVSISVLFHMQNRTAIVIPDDLREKAAPYLS
jgi:acyl-CoA thioester hydrolase